MRSREAPGRPNERQNGFSFDTTGASPAAHVFVGPAAGGFDYHYPGALAEVTALIPKPVVSGNTVTVNLSALNIGLGAGLIPASDTIYVRAHAKLSSIQIIPADGTEYVFRTSTTTLLHNRDNNEPSTANSQWMSLPIRDASTANSLFLFSKLGIKVSTAAPRGAPRVTPQPEMNAGTGIYRSPLCIRRGLPLQIPAV